VIIDVAFGKVLSRTNLSDRAATSSRSRTVSLAHNPTRPRDRHLIQIGFWKLVGDDRPVDTERHSMHLDIADLERAAAFWENAGYLATFIVILGVIGESIADLTTWIKDERRRHLVERASVLLLIAGLSVEILAQVQSNDKNSLIAGVLNERASTAEKAAAEAKLELTKMREDRMIESKTAEVLVAGLRRFGRKNFWIIEQSNGATGYSEQGNFVQQLTRIFLGAGWISDPHTYRNEPSKTDPEKVAVGDPGCSVSISFDSSLNDAQAFLIGELAKSYIVCKPRPDFSLRPDTVVVEIGLHTS
jgi:hypothetical protein